VPGATDNVEDDKKFAETNGVGTRKVGEVTRAGQALPAGRNAWPAPGHLARLSASPLHSFSANFLSSSTLSVAPGTDRALGCDGFLYSKVSKATSDFPESQPLPRSQTGRTRGATSKLVGDALVTGMVT